MKPDAPRNRLSQPLVNSGVPGSLVLDNYIIAELFFREDHPEYFTEEQRTFEAIVEEARRQREADEREAGQSANDAG
jgi:hypothetical protein